MKHFLRDASIQTKLLLSHIFLIAIPTLTLIILFYTRFYNLIVNDSIRQSLAIASQTSNSVDATMNQISAISSALRSNSYMNRLFNSSTSELAQLALEGDSDQLRDLSTLIHSEIDGTLITSIHVYTDRIPEFLYGNDTVDDFFLPLEASNATYWRGIFASTAKYSLYCPAFYLSHAEINQYGPLAYIEKIYPGSTASDGTPSYLAIYFSEEALSSLLQQSETFNSEVFYIINERNSLVASSDTALAGTYYMDYNTVRSLSSSDEGYTKRTVLGKEVFAVSNQIGDTDWYLVSVLPSEQVLKRGQTVIWTIVILYSVMLAVAFFIAFHMSRSITKRLQIVNDQMRIVRSGPPVRVPEPTKHDEIGELTDSYNYMTDEMNALIENEKKSAEELRISEVRALQAQINPHFLYNTMDMINWLSQTGQAEEVTDAIQALSRFYKLTLSNKKDYATVGSELEHVELYVKLQNMRYEDQIEFVADVADDLKDVELPKLTLQPIVENSILHGILEKPERSGVIVVTGWRDGNDLVLLISDDGVGMDENTCRNIITGEHNVSTGNNIAVRNTHRRLQMLYGNYYGLTYRSVPGQGTEVEIRVPFQT